MGVRSLLFTKYRNSSLVGIVLFFSFVVFEFFLSGQENPNQNNSSIKKILNGNRNLSNIALTFDDGPHQYFTPALLNIFEEHSIKATFFVVGKMVKINPSLVEAISGAGHEIGNHTYNHFELPTLKDEKIEEELELVRDEILKITGKRINIFRPPSGRYNDRVLNIANKLGYTMVLWAINSGDYGSTDYRRIKNRILDNIKPGDIVLLHSGVEATLTALPEIIETLRNRGFNFVTVSDLINGIKK